MFEKDAEGIAKDIYIHHFDDDVNYPDVLKAIIVGVQKGAEFGYNKANEWHYVKDELPEIDVLVYLWNKIDDFPVVACRHIPYGQKKWVWDCKWGSGFTVSQLVGEDYLWKEMVLPELKESK